jgi:hypothetical protein
MEDMPAKYWRGKMTDEYDSWRRYEDAKAFKNKLAEIDRLKGRIEKLEAALRELSCKCTSNCDWERDDICPSWTARKALEGKDD